MKQTFWVGIVDKKIHFYGIDDCYQKVFHGDLFKRKKDALRCYEEAVKVRLEIEKKKVKNAERKD